MEQDALEAWLNEHIDTEYSVIQLLKDTKQPLAAFYYQRKLAERVARGDEDEDVVMADA